VAFDISDSDTVQSLEAEKEPWWSELGEKNRLFENEFDKGINA
jgi:hypothetical protein